MSQLNIPPYRSVSYQILGTFLLVILAALAGFSASLKATEQMKQDAQRINIAGSLRMLSTRAALAYYTSYTSGNRNLINEVLQSLKDRLNNPILDAGSIDSRQQLKAIRNRWQSAESHFLAMELPPDFIRESIDRLVNQIDTFVLSVQHDSEQKVQRMEKIQLLALMTVFGASILMIWMIRQRIQKPLSRLVNAHHKVQNKQFNTRLPNQAQDEFGVLATSFNAMTEQLSRLYHSLEDEVARQTRALNARNTGLNALFSISGDLHAEPINAQTLKHVLGHMKQAIGARYFKLLLVESEHPVQYCQLHTQARPVLHHLPPGEYERAQMACQSDPQHVLGFALASGGEQLGLMVARFDQPAEPWQHQLCAMLATVIVQALTDHLQHEQATREALQEERTAIGRDLHDSLAQSLAYLKIQLTKAHRLLERGRTEEIGATLEEAREGLNAAYTQLRELLTTFRLQIQEPGLEQALRGACTEFAARGEQLDIQLHWDVPEIRIDANEAIHILQIVREALSNVVRHAQATQAIVKLSYATEGHLELVIEDNGRGMQAERSEVLHHGLRIMQERAQALPEGQFEIESPTDPGGHGTRIRVRFAHQHQPEQQLKVVPHAIQ